MGLILLSILGLIVGLIKPETVKLKSRGKVGLIFGAAMIVFLTMFGAATPNTPVTQTPVLPTSTNPTPVVAIPAPVIQTPVTTKKPVTVKPISQPTPAPVQTQTPIPAPQTVNQNTSPVSNETVSQKNAVAKAIDYLSFSGFSHDGLVAQLEYDQFSQADAIYGADNSGANWDEQAAIKAKSYMSFSAFSRGGLIAQLEYDKFTQAQAEYGANAVGL